MQLITSCTAAAAKLVIQLNVSVGLDPPWTGDA